MNFVLNLGIWNSIFAVPSCIVDEHIKLAGSAQLKVLLWILRNAGSNFNVDDIASFLSMHPADVKDALQYWVETKVININDDNIIIPQEPTIEKNKETKTPVVHISNNNNIKSENNINTAIKNKEEQTKPKRLTSRPQRPDSIYVANRINGSKEIAYLIQEAEIILARPLSNGDTSVLIMIHDNDGLPVDVILMLLQYSVGIGKKNMSYIEKVAIEWATEEIDTIDKAENKIRHLNNSKLAWSKIERIFGIDKRSPTSKESEFANKWINEWHFRDDVIKEAYDRCIELKGKYLPAYIDSIIRNWYNQGITTVEQAMDERSTRKSKNMQTNHYSSSYNLDEYESVSIFD